MAVKIEKMAPAPATSGAEFPELDGDAAAMTTPPEDRLPEIDPVQEDKQEEPSPEKPAPLTEKEVIARLDSKVLRMLLEQKLLEEAKKAEENFKPVKAPHKAPKGMLWVFNRTPKVFEWQYDSVVYEIDGHDMILLPERVARHGKKKSILSLDPVANTAVFKLALEDDPKFGRPLKVVSRIELLDRTHNPNILGRGADVPNTHPAVLQVAGVAEMLARRQDQFVELED